jgi:hypothetical protein
MKEQMIMTGSLNLPKVSPPLLLLFPFFLIFNADSLIRGEKKFSILFCIKGLPVKEDL